ncbi:MAG: sulfotransferase family 2 domain-containing protein [Luminiphilus sp.]|nr:sulfotransferase family 2 domain-containing protein [Luminiphilus sp.]
MVVAQKHIVIHHHLFKNAGSTLDLILARHFKETWQTFDIPNRAVGSLKSEELAEFLTRRPHLQAISTHQAKLSFTQTPGYCFYPLVFLRHPIDRIGSVYAFLKRLPEHDLREHVLMAKKHSLADFVKWRLDQRFGASIRNFQTSMLCNDHINLAYKHAEKNDLEVAKGNISALEFFGLVAHFDASIEAMKQYLSPQFGAIDIEYAVQNRSEDRDPSLHRRLDELLQSLGSSLYAELERANALDMALYHHAENLFISRGLIN